MAQRQPHTQQKYFTAFIGSYLEVDSEGCVAELLRGGATGVLVLEHAAENIRSDRMELPLSLSVNFETDTTATIHALSSMRAVGGVDIQSQFGVTRIDWQGIGAMRCENERDVSQELIATVAAKDLEHARSIPLAQYQISITLDVTFTQPLIVHRLGLFEVPPRGDGVVCLVRTNESIALAMNRRHARVLGRGFHHDHEDQILPDPRTILPPDAAKCAGALAYATAGVAATDIDVAEPFAPGTIVEVLGSDALGFKLGGTSASNAAKGRTSSNGDIPIIISGGLTSRGHPACVTLLYLLEPNEQILGKAGGRQVQDATLAVGSTELRNWNVAMLPTLENVG